MYVAAFVILIWLGLNYCDTFHVHSVRLLYQLGNITDL